MYLPETLESAWYNGDVTIYQLDNNIYRTPQQLKDYISTIQEPIEFIAESSIDDVLIKEWIGKWGHKYIPFQNISIKTGSPKLDGNGVFKINW